MARFNKKQRMTVESSMYDLHRFMEWVKSSNIEICRVGSPPGIAYSNQDGRTLQTICKDGGSPLQFVENSLDRLTRLHSEMYET